jgi:hypothetical protein
MTKAIKIDPKAQTITPIEIVGYEALRDAVGGYITVVPTAFGTLYIDDKGLINNTREFFAVQGYPQPLAGNGVLFGETDEGGKDTDVMLSVDEVTTIIRFLTEDEVAHWTTINAAIPAVAVHVFNEDGTIETTVKSTYGEIMAHMVPPEETETPS